jgi:hypothetical protein
MPATISFFFFLLRSVNFLDYSPVLLSNINMLLPLHVSFAE